MIYDELAERSLFSVHGVHSYCMFEVNPSSGRLLVTDFWLWFNGFTIYISKSRSAENGVIWVGIS